MKTDIELVTLAQSGNIEAIGSLYDRYHQAIYRFVVSRIHDPQTAEDITGDVFTRMVVHLPTYRWMDVPFRAWLYRIANNLMVDYFRKKDVHKIITEGHARVDFQNSPALVVEQRLTMAEVRAALERIDPAQRDVVVLRFIAGLSLEEVAQTVQKSISAVKSLQHRGIKALRVAIKTADFPIG